MRLSTDQVQAIHQTAQRVLGDGARVSVLTRKGDVTLLPLERRPRREHPVPPLRRQLQNKG